MISAKRMLFVAEKVLLSEIVLSRRNTESVIKNVNKKVAALCKKKKGLFLSVMEIFFALIFKWQIKPDRIKQIAITYDFIYNLKNVQACQVTVQTYPYSHQH